MLSSYLLLSLMLMNSYFQNQNYPINNVSNYSKPRGSKYIDKFIGPNTPSYESRYYYYSKPTYKKTNNNTVEAKPSVSNQHEQNKDTKVEAVATSIQKLLKLDPKKMEEKAEEIIEKQISHYTQKYKQEVPKSDYQKIKEQIISSSKSIKSMPDYSKIPVSSSNSFLTDVALNIVNSKNSPNWLTNLICNYAETKSNKCIQLKMNLYDEQLAEQFNSLQKELNQNLNKDLNLNTTKEEQNNTAAKIVNECNGSCDS